MKYAHLIGGLLIGTIIGGAIVAKTKEVGATSSTIITGSGAAMSTAEIQQIVRKTIMDEPKLIMDSVQKFQMDQHSAELQGANQALKDPAVHKALYDTPNTAFAGNKDGKKIVVEFFDYNCPACKMMFTGLERVLKEDKDVKVIFKELPIFGPSSERNSKIGFAVWHLYPNRYYEFHGKVMGKPGHAEEKAVNDAIGEMGLDRAKLEADAKNPDYATMIEDNRKLGEKLNIQGTPTLVIGQEVVPSALGYDDLKTKLSQPGQ